MKRQFIHLALAAASFWPALAGADLTLAGYSAAGAFGMPMSSQERIWIRDHIIRRDYVDRGRFNSHLFDLARRRVYVIDHASRQIERHDLTNLQAAAEISAPTDSMKITLERTGQTRPLKHWSCEAYKVGASIPARLGNEETLFHLNGTIWIAADVPEQAEVKSLVKLARQPDFFLGIPAVAKVTPAQATLFSEIIRKLAPRGLPCGCDIEARYEGNGPMADLARRMPTRLNIAFQDFNTEPVKTEVFMLPMGYAIRP